MKQLCENIKYRYLRVIFLRIYDILNFVKTYFRKRQHMLLGAKTPLQHTCNYLNYEEVYMY
jgi:hypothetical protein